MSKRRMKIMQGDITTLEVDAVVNAANSSLRGGGGVDGAIHAAAGPVVLQECSEIVDSCGKCPTGKSVITSGGNLKAKHIIHTVGPVWRGGREKEPELLADCYRNSLTLAAKNYCRTIAFPNISTGIYGYPKDKAAKISVKTVHEFLQYNESIETVVFVCYDNLNLASVKKEMAKIK